MLRKLKNASCCSSALICVTMVLEIIAFIFVFTQKKIMTRFREIVENLFI